MNKINFPENQNIIKQNYFILPYYQKSSIVYIKMFKDDITWFNYQFSKIKQLKKINKSLQYFYKNSRFNGYSIMIIGYLNKYNNFQSLGIFDLMLENQFNGLMMSKKYSIRRDNINLRFLINIPNNIKNVHSVFSKKYSEDLFNGMCTQCILSNKWEGYSLYSDNVFSENNMISKKIWNICNGKIAKVEFDQKSNKIISIVVEQEKTNKLYNIFYGLESLKNDNIINEKCKFKMCQINNKNNIIFLNLN